MKSHYRQSGVSLIEVLAVITIIAILAALLFPMTKYVMGKNSQTAALVQMRQIGVAFTLYAGENEFRLPNRQRDGSLDKWPRLLAKYLGDDIRVYAAPGDPNNYLIRGTDPLNNSRNNTSFIMNGYNDLGGLTEDVEVRLTRMDAANVILLGTPYSGSTHFYMDMLEGKTGNHIDVLNLEAYGDGSNYLFADGSARFITKNNYDPTMWLVDKSFPVPE